MLNHDKLDFSTPALSTNHLSVVIYTMLNNIALIYFVAWRYVKLRMFSLYGHHEQGCSSYKPELHPNYEIETA